MAEESQGVLHQGILHRWRSALLPLTAAGVALAVAVVGALLTGDGITGINGFIEALSGRSSSALGRAGTLLPLGFAFAAGMASTVNPCGFAMLPAYLGLYLGAGDKQSEVAGVMERLTRALLVGSVVTAGFILLFGVVGVIIGAGSRSVIGAFAWIGLSVGVLLTLGGAWLLRGGVLYSSLGERAAARIGDPRQVGVRAYFLFGLSYGTASLSCTLPIFLAVVGSSLVVSGLVSAIGQFIAYAVGMGAVLMTLTLAMDLFKGAMVGTLRKILPYIQPGSAVLMLLAGSYIVYYWLTIGGLLDGSSF